MRIDAVNCRHPSFATVVTVTVFPSDFLALWLCASDAEKSVLRRLASSNGSMSDHLMYLSEAARILEGVTSKTEVEGDV